MDIYLIPSGGRSITFPLMPEQIEMGADGRFMSYNIISLGEVKIPRGKGIKEVSWTGMFPGPPRAALNYLVRRRAWSPPNMLAGRLEAIRDAGDKCVLLIPGTVINMPVYISRFKGRYKGGSGDFFYEIKFIAAREIRVYTLDELKKRSQSERPEPQKVSHAAIDNKHDDTAKTMSYQAKEGESLWGVAQQNLGSGSRYEELAELNKSVIESHGGGSFAISSGDSLTIPSK